MAFGAVLESSFDDSLSPIKRAAVTPLPFHNMARGRRRRAPGRRKASGRRKTSGRRKAPRRRNQDGGIFPLLALAIPALAAAGAGAGFGVKKALERL